MAKPFSNLLYKFPIFRSNAADEKFDHTVGALEDIVMGK